MLWTRAFGVDGVPSSATFHAVRVVIENPGGFYPKEMD